MQASRSLFQTGIKLNKQPSPPTGIRKSIPFLNIWAPSSASTSPALSKSEPSPPFQQSRPAATMASATSVYDFKPIDKKGQPHDLNSYHNKVILIVNTASKCGFTPQYAGLEKLYKKISSNPSIPPSSFIILGFPCNQFGNQEPGSNDDVQSFCQVNYGVTFPMLGKCDVNGDGEDPLWAWLKKEKPGLMGLKRVKWNFEKFLVGRDGQVKGRWASTTKPESLEQDILKEINEGAQTDEKTTN
ncbi:MAG: hypothetical protein M1833_001512 [Piccolia ochrophora]|nr:MAG: hypothetical protein M1833_001512 [Piccolia ochrophora]